MDGQGKGKGGSIRPQATRTLLKYHYSEIAMIIKYNKG